eukprot:TRINITY_DN300_c7_g1_i2.p1 TRINITY_DN300_c7_g1~~TRINITY_DN300_c7_g1_i2.p1  ORF type:complete len:150 (+),score=28.89 TRINITY_DN300_c7_g1_i2:77-526(+)
MFLRTGVRLNKTVASDFFKNWSSGDLSAAKASFTSSATVTCGSVESVKRIPFTGKHEVEAFLEKSSAALKIKSVNVSDLQGTDASFFAAAEVDCTVNRTDKEAKVPSLFHGTFADGKIQSLVCHPETGAWESAFSSHGESVKGTENKWD